ncbi:hypothetical protein FJY84_01550 [Candidatus Bathyarchaeota archaeon]|nr:hypothetical protein [Candidatus Bathyarchaeota archaeon]
MTTNYKYGYTLLALYLIENIKKNGSQEALTMLDAASDQQGIILAEEYKKILPKDLSPLELGAEAYKLFMTDTGSEVFLHKKNDDDITFRIQKCPFHEIYLNVGIDCGYFLNGLCSNLILPSIKATLNHLNKNLRIEPMLTRETAEDFCLIKIIYDKPKN